MERRTYATGKVWLRNIELLISSPDLSFEEYPDEHRDFDSFLSAMVGDLQRIIEYPKMGFQIKQDVPDEVIDAYTFLVQKGFTGRLIKK